MLYFGDTWHFDLQNWGPGLYWRCGDTLRQLESAALPPFGKEVGDAFLFAGEKTGLRGYLKSSFFVSKF